MSSGDFGIVLHRPAPTFCQRRRSTCGSVCSSALNSDCGNTISSLHSVGPGDACERELSEALLAATTSRMNSAPLAGADAKAPAEQLFGWLASRAGSDRCSVGYHDCRCDICITTKKEGGVGGLPPHQHRQGHQQHCFELLHECFSTRDNASGQAFAMDDLAESYCGACAASSAIPASASPQRQPKLRTPAAAAVSSNCCTDGAAAPPQRPRLRRTARGGTILPFSPHFSNTAACLVDTRCVAASTSPIPVPSPASGTGSHRPAVARPSVEPHLAGEGARGAEGKAAPGATGDIAHSSMLRVIMRFYDAVHKERAARPPRRPLEPQRVVVGFELS